MIEGTKVRVQETIPKREAGRQSIGPLVSSFFFNAPTCNTDHAYPVANGERNHDPHGLVPEVDRKWDKSGDSVLLFLLSFESPPFPYIYRRGGVNLQSVNADSHPSLNILNAYRLCLLNEGATR